MLSTSLAARTGLHQTVNPHLIIVGTLLELSNAELELMIREELERNPALEAEAPEGPPEGGCGEMQPPWELETPEPNLWAKSSPMSGSAAGTFDRMTHVPAGTSLRDYLRWQFRAAAPKPLHTVGEYLIAYVNADGYLECSLVEAAEALEAPLDDLEVALTILQDLDPSGIAARDLHECLLLQLRHLDSQVDLPDHLADVIEASTSDGPARLADIARRTRLPMPQTQTCLEFIRAHFAPYPGRAVRTSWGEIVGETQPHTIPDAIISLEGDHLTVRIPESYGFRLRLNGAYRRLADALELENSYVRSGRRSSEVARAREQAAECVQRARGLIQQVQQRNRTLWQVATAVANRQKAFLTHGADHLLPLTKKEIAQSLRIHESIVCRATRGKHVMLPSGEVVGFEVFFDDALPVKHLVHGLIAGENPAKPLSDADIAHCLASNGIDIARRTVTKYRRALRIPPARDRLQWSTAGGQ